MAEPSGFFNLNAFREFSQKNWCHGRSGVCGDSIPEVCQKIQRIRSHAGPELATHENENNFYEQA